MRCWGRIRFLSATGDPWWRRRTAGLGHGRHSLRIDRHAENADGSTNTSFDGDVTVSLYDFGETAGILGGTVTVTAVNGVAAFSGLSVDQAGYYALSVASAGMNPIRPTPLR